MSWLSLESVESPSRFGLATGMAFNKSIGGLPEPDRRRRARRRPGQKGSQISCPNLLESGSRSTSGEANTIRQMAGRRDLGVDHFEGREAFAGAHRQASRATRSLSAGDSRPVNVAHGCLDASAQPVGRGVLWFTPSCSFTPFLTWAKVGDGFASTSCALAGSLPSARLAFPLPLCRRRRPGRKLGPKSGVAASRPSALPRRTRGAGAVVHRHAT